MGEIRWRQALPTGVADALIWVWFLQTAYLSRFTEQLGLMNFMAQAMPYLSIGVCIVLSLFLVALRWDAAPAPYRILCSLIAVSAPATMLSLDYLELGESFAAIAIYLLFVAAYYGSQILRIETLAKCPNIRTLAMALITSLATYYGISLVLLVIPLAAYNTIVVMAPLALLYRTWRPLAPMPDSESCRQRSWRRALFAESTALLVLFGISGGLISAHGGSNPALTLTSLFRMPDPAHLVMVLANMGLGILAARTLHVPRCMYFALLSVIWMSGSFLGACLINFLPPLPDAVFMVLAGVIAVAIVASFVVRREVWIQGSEAEPVNAAGAATRPSEDNLPPERPDESPSPSEKSESIPDDPIALIAAESSLTPRETEIMQLLAEGRSVPIICERLVISEGTARTHVKHIYQKLGVHNRQELLNLVRG